jgi:lipopolysaccharide export system protein LptA
MSRSRSTPGLRAASAAAVLLAATLVSPRMSAEPAADDPPVEVSADKLDLDVEAKTALLTGHVKLSRATMALACPRVELRYDRIPHVTWARGSGGVVAEVKGVHAEAPEVELDLTARTMELRGGVRISQGNGWITADRATIQLATGKVSMTDVKGSIPLPKPTP